MNDQTHNSPEFSNKLNQFFFFALIIAIGISFVFYITPFRAFYKDETPIKEIYFADNISPAHRIIIDKFNAQNAGKIKVIPIDLPFEKFTTNERKELLARSLRGKNSKFDIFAVDQIWVPRFSKWAQPLDAYFSKDQIDEIRPELRSTIFNEKKLMSIPLYMDIGVLFYRKDILDRIPEKEDLINELDNAITWDRLMEVKINHFPDDEIFVFQADDYEGLICNYLEFLNARSNKFFSNGEFQIVTDEGIMACERMLSLISKGASTSEVVNFNENKSYAYAIENDIPFFRAWPSMLKNKSLISEDQVYKLEHIGMAPLPREMEGVSTSVIGGWNLMISADSDNKEECVKFLEYCLSEEAQTILFNEGGFLPVSKSIYDLETIQTLKQLDGLIPYGVHRPSHVDYSSISDILSGELHRILKGEVSIESGLKIAQRKIDLEMRD